GSGLNQIRKRFRKFSRQIKGSDKRKPVFIKRITTPFFAFYLFSRDLEFLDIYLKKKLKKRVKDHGCTCECTNKPFQQRHIKKMKLVQVGMLQVVTFFVSIRIIDGETRIGIFANRYITKGEHLTYDYHIVFSCDTKKYSTGLFSLVQIKIATVVHHVVGNS
ncbi:hypothetical protein HID58_013998, partial [Brassica napus]